MKQDEVELRISISVIQPLMGGGGIRMEENLAIPAKSFMDVCLVLGQFQELARKIKEGR